MQDIKQCLDSAVMFTNAKLDIVLLSLLDKHAPLIKCQVSDKKCVSWYKILVTHFKLQKSVVARRKDAGALSTKNV